MRGGRACSTPARRLASAVGIVFALAPGSARSHQLDSASLSLKEIGSGSFLVRWQASSRTLQDDLGTAVIFPQPCRVQGERLGCGPGGLVGTIAFPWLEGTTTRVMVDIEWQSGRRLLRVVGPSSPGLKVYGIPASGLRALAPIVFDYTRLGVEHILTGFDHLLFVVALALLVRRGRQLLATITAFTVAHSVSLAVTVLGLVHVPSAPVEASIALSIVLVCRECLSPADSLARRAPWAVAFVFGLLHGLGFASALLDLGVPEQHVPAALLCFNVGVELGQLAIIAVVIGLRRIATRLGLDRDWTRHGLIYAMGGIAAFWSLDRLGAVFGG
ncbi:MAG TPA: HupE/UreJ family protein [Polyangia bacterium]|nr:HupE/UreJ family protein [Polyangia bacterium]